MGASGGARVSAKRLAPGAFKCPSCRHIFDNKDAVECIRPDRKKGKVVCWECGIAWLKNHERIPKSTTGPVQSKGQQSLNLKGDVDNE